MSPRIAYWTSAFEPWMEAIASEVAVLRRHFPGSVAWGLSHRHRALVSWRRGVYCLHPRLHLLFRAGTRIFEPAFHLNHVFGSPGDWFYLAGGRTRPTILTVAALGEPADRELLQRVDRFVVEYPVGREYLGRLGVHPSRVRLIFPPVDLDRYTPSSPPGGPFTVLFASSPDDHRWLDARGIPALLDAASLQPAMRFRLLWRPWGDGLPTVRRWIAERGLENVELVVGRSTDMPSHYRASHVTIAPFVQIDRCKPMPNSLIESLACGRPVLATPHVGLAGLLRDEGAGLIAPGHGPDLAEALDRLRSSWGAYAERARRVAERYFSEQSFICSYIRLYQELI